MREKAIDTDPQKGYILEFSDIDFKITMVYIFNNLMTKRKKIIRGMEAMKSIRQKNPEFKNTITEIKMPSRGQMGLTEADEINKNEKTSTHINMYDSHDVDRKSKFQKHTVQQ